MRISHTARLKLKVVPRRRGSEGMSKPDRNNIYWRPFESARTRLERQANIPMDTTWRPLKANDRICRCG